MGITADQVTRAHLNRLGRHFAALKAAKAAFEGGGGWRAREEIELHAWAFARVLVTSDSLKELVRCFDECARAGLTIQELDATVPTDENIPRPLWALELAELVGKATKFLRHVEPDYNAELYGAEDALDMIEAWPHYGTLPK